MSSFYPPVPLGSRFTTALQDLDGKDGLPFATLISEAEVPSDLHSPPDDRLVWTPAVTLWAFLSQALSSSKSCVAAVARVLVLRVSLDLAPCSANTGAYCKARTKLSETLLRQLTGVIGCAVEDQAPDCWRCHQRRVLLADGFEVTGPDTPANQRVYPQPRSQKPGLGFPMIRVVVLLAFATAVLIDAALGPHQGKETGETALFRQLLGSLRAGDLLVADRFYCSYWMIALLKNHGADAAFRLHQRRHYDFRRGRRLGSGDHVVVWTKPQRPAWLSADEYAALPDTLEVREVVFKVATPGYRSREIVVATTLTDAAAYPKKDIADLYHHRWHAELDIRAIKQTLRMEYLTCKTPAMLRRELWVHLLAYNLVRRALAAAAAAQGLCPRQLSFAGGLQTLEMFRLVLLFCAEEQRAKIYAIVLVALATHRVGDRPGRCEPRKVKRRPKPYGLLTKPREEARAELLRN
jgi:hypothetical protein